MGGIVLLVKFALGKKSLKTSTVTDEEIKKVFFAATANKFNIPIVVFFFWIIWVLFFLFPWILVYQRYGLERDLAVALIFMSSFFMIGYLLTSLAHSDKSDEVQ